MLTALGCWWPRLVLYICTVMVSFLSPKIISIKINIVCKLNAHYWFNSTSKQFVSVLISCIALCIAITSPIVVVLRHQTFTLYDSHIVVVFRHQTFTLYDSHIVVVFRHQTFTLYDSHIVVVFRHQTFTL